LWIDNSTCISSLSKELNLLAQLYATQISWYQWHRIKQAGLGFVYLQFRLTNKGDIFAPVYEGVQRVFRSALTIDDEIRRLFAFLSRHPWE